MLMAYPITKFGCEAINYSDPAGSYRIAWWTWLVTILKLAEFLETVRTLRILQNFSLINCYDSFGTRFHHQNKSRKSCRWPGTYALSVILLSTEPSVFDLHI